MLKCSVLKVLPSCGRTHLNWCVQFYYSCMPQLFAINTIQSYFLNRLRFAKFRVNYSLPRVLWITVYIGNISLLRRRFSWSTSTGDTRSSSNDASLTTRAGGCSSMPRTDRLLVCPFWSSTSRQQHIMSAFFSTRTTPRRSSPVIRPRRIIWSGQLLDLAYNTCLNLVAAS